MKKIISLIVSVLLLVSCLGFTVLADDLKPTGDNIASYENCSLPEDQNITFSKDLKTLYVGKQSYSRLNTKGMYLETDYEVPNLKIIDYEYIEAVDLSANKKGNVIYAEVSYKDGSMLSCTFLDDNYRKEVDDILNNENDDLFVAFNLKDEPYFRVDTDKLYVKKVKVKFDDFYYDSETFDVEALTSDESISINKGYLHISSDKIYFESSVQADAEKYNEEYWDLYEIQDPQLVEKLIEKKQQYYNESEYGLFMDDEILEAVSRALVIIFFIVLPFAIMVMSIIFVLRTKRKMYRDIFITTGILAGVQTIIFVICSFILFK